MQPSTKSCTYLLTESVIYNIKSNNYLTWSAWYLLLPSSHVMMQSRPTADGAGSEAKH